MIASPETDVKVGMLVYSTTSPRHQVKLRERRDDFRVEEIIDFSEIKNRLVKGYFPVYRVEKSGTDTIHMAAMLANRLKSKISFAGLKDRRAQTIQYISPISSKVKSLDSVVHELFKAELIGYAERPITKRSMIGNSFRIMLRDSSSDLIESVEHVYSKCRERRLPNFFGYQRFGSGSAITHSVGRAILHRNFGEAIRIILCEPREGERETVNEARKLSSAQRYSEAYTMFSGKQDLERRVLQHLLKKKDDFLGALRALPLIIRRLFINGSVNLGSPPCTGRR